jgi:hypothetical protein
MPSRPLPRRLVPQPAAEGPFVRAGSLTGGDAIQGFAFLCPDGSSGPIRSEQVRLVGDGTDAFAHLIWAPQSVAPPGCYAPRPALSNQTVVVTRAGCSRGSVRSRGPPMREPHCGAERDGGPVICAGSGDDPPSRQPQQVFRKVNDDRGIPPARERAACYF